MTDGKVTAEIALLNAAALIRERALLARDEEWSTECTEHLGGEMGAHAAPWSPAVALDAAEVLEVIERDCGTSSLAYHAAAKFARAYLGEQA